MTGESSLADYQFGARDIHHRFCRTCGTQVFGEASLEQLGGAFYAVTGVAQIAAAFYPRPVIVRFSDFKTNEYARLLGGEDFEPHEENPMIGYA